MTDVRAVHLPPVTARNFLGARASFPDREVERRVHPSGSGETSIVRTAGSTASIVFSPCR
jgi:hypothetical protein